MLTKTQIEQVKAPATGFSVVWDHDLPGFGVRVLASSKRSFIVRYRLGGSRQKQTVTIGTYGLITLVQARAKAQEILATAKLGTDPQAEYKARAQTEAEQARALTVRDLVTRYDSALRAGQAKTNRSRGRPVAAYVADTARHLERFAAEYGKQVAAAITRPDVVRLLNDYVEQPSVHRRMHGAINRMFAWARRAELVPNNPTADIVTGQASARERVLSLEELALIWHAAKELDLLYRDYVHLMITTGQRRTEVAAMTWDEIQLGAGLWILPAARTKARRQHVLPLPSLATAVLQARHQAAGRAPERGSLVMPTLSRDGSAVPISGWNWLKRELDRRVDIAPWTLHDFRRSLVTICANHEVDIAVLDSMLNHAASATRGGIVDVYQRSQLIEPMRKAMATWDRLLRQAIAGGGGVVAFPAITRG